IIAISWLVCDQNYKILEKGNIISGDEKKIINSFIDVINNTVAHIYVTFNGKRFDVPLIIYKSYLYKHKIKMKNFYYLYKFIDYTHFDIHMYVSSFGEFPISSRVFSTSIGLPDPKENVSGSEVGELWKKSQTHKILEYCDRDTMSNYEGFKYLDPQDFK